MKFSDNKMTVIKAFAEARRLVVTPKKSAQNTHLKNHYSTLDDVSKAIDPALENAGLIIIQSPTHEDGQAKDVLLMETIIMHVESGEWMADVCQIPLAKADCQAFGSSLTYARRYAKTAIFDLKMKDDDGNKSVLTAKSYTDRIKVSKDPQEIESMVRDAAERLGDEAMLRVVRDAASTRKSAIKMEGAVAFNPAKPRNAKVVADKSTGGNNAAPETQVEPFEPDAGNLNDF